MADELFEKVKRDLKEEKLFNTNFAKKENIKPSDLKTVGAVNVPPVYFWLDIGLNDKPVLMTAAVMWNGMKFGLSFPVDENKVRARMDSSKLIVHMREVASVLALHGKEVLGNDNQLDMKKINEQEAIRFKFDPSWRTRTRAVDALIRVKDITKEQARKLKLCQ